MDGFETTWHGVGVGGRLALDFVNTKDWRRRDATVEGLHVFADLLRWARTAGILTASEARVLRTWADAHPRAAARTLTEAIAVREAIAVVFQAVARGGEVPSGPLGQLEAACQQAFAARLLRAGSGGTGAAWAWRGLEPSRPALAAALDAEHLLTSEER